MNKETCDRNEKMLMPQKDLLQTENDRKAGKSGVTLEELEETLDAIMEGTR